ncbi:MAG: hypothetical protein K6T65_16665 [Peptococcaceae bacterium]|nr:hypothetical protein [Peptococcaceae bacterium]
MRKYCLALLGLLLVFILLITLAGCGGSKQAEREAKQEKVGEVIKKELGKGVQEALQNPAQSREAQGNVTAKYRVGEEFMVPFRVSKWESKDKKVSKECKSVMKINGWEMRDKAGKEIPKNGAFLVVNITIAGDAECKDISELGTFLVVSPLVDTAEGPKFSVVDAGGKQYVYDFKRGIYVNDPLAPSDLGDVFVKDPKPKTLNMAFDVPSDIAKPKLWIECIKMNNQKEITEVDLGSPGNKK